MDRKLLRHLRLFALVVVLFATTVCLSSCNMDSKREHITIYSKTYWVDDNINIDLKEGFWVEDYDIDYNNNRVVLHLTEEDGADDL